MIFTKTKMGTNPVKLINEMIERDKNVNRKLDMLDKKVSILHIDDGDQVIDGEKIYYLTFVYKMGDK
jgi:hypothetical protein